MQKYTDQMVSGDFWFNTVLFPVSSNTSDQQWSQCFSVLASWGPTKHQMGVSDL